MEMGCMINFQVLQLYDKKKEVIIGNEWTSKPVHCVSNEQSTADCEKEHVKGMGEWKEKVEYCNTNKQVDPVKLYATQLSPQGNTDYKISCEKCKPWQNCFAL